MLDGVGGYIVHSIAEKEGSVSADGRFVDDGSGSPGVWLKEVKDGVVVSTLLPLRGAVEGLLRQAKEVDEDPRIPALRLANPAV